jgi:hypothetical protein
MADKGKTKQKRETDKWEVDRFVKRDQFEKLLENEDLRRDVFNEKYFDALERRRDAITAASTKRQSLVWIGMLFLGLSVLSVHLPVSIFGLSGDAKNLREILLLALSTLQVAGLTPELEKANITDHLFALVSFVSKGDETVARALRLRFGIQPPNMIPNLNFPRRSGMQIVTFLFTAIGFVGWFLLMTGVFISIQVAALIDIVRDPSVSSRVSWCVVLYALFADAGSLGIHRMTAIVSAYNERQEAKAAK